MRTLALVSILGAVLALGCSKDDGKDKKEVYTCGGKVGLNAVCGKIPVTPADKPLKKAVTPGIMPDGTKAEALTAEQEKHFVNAYARALVYDNALDEIIKPLRKQQGSRFSAASLFAPMAALATSDLNDREKKMFDALKAKCASGKKNEKKEPLGDSKMRVSVDYFIATGEAGTCPIDNLVNETITSEISQPDANTIKTIGEVLRVSTLNVKDQALVDELGIVTRIGELNANAEFFEVARNKTTTIGLSWNSEIEDRISGPYRIEALVGSWESANGEGLEYLESKAALVYRMKGYTVLLQLFGTQSKGEAEMKGKIYLNGRALEKNESLKLRR